MSTWYKDKASKAGSTAGKNKGNRTHTHLVHMYLTHSSRPLHMQRGPRYVCVHVDAPCGMTCSCILICAVCVSVC